MTPEAWATLASILAERALPALGATALLGLLALARRSVSGTGALGGLLVGTLFWLGGDWPLWLLLTVFFLSSTLVGLPAKRYRPRLEDKHLRGSRRSWQQVAANTGPMALLALPLPFLVAAGATQPHLWAIQVALVAGFSAAAADTWAGEIGVLSRRPPRLLWGCRLAEPGQSGGVTWLGTVAGAGGAAALAAVGLLSGIGMTGWAIAAGWGLASSLLDSLLGATTQALYRGADGQWTEKPVDESGRPHTLVRGLRWMNNDSVNLVSVSFAVTGAFLFAWFWA